MRLGTTIGILGGATLLAVPAAAFAHPSPGLSVWAQSVANGSLTGSITGSAAVQVTTHSSIPASTNSHSSSSMHQAAGMAQVEGVLTAPVSVAAKASATATSQATSNIGRLVVMFGRHATVRPLHSIKTMASVQPAGTLSLAGGQSYAMAAGATVTCQGRPYAGTMLYPGERIHAALKRGQVVAIQLQSASAWETYQGRSSASVQLSYAGGATFSAPLAPAAIVRTATGTTAASASTLAAGMLVRAAFNSQGQVILLQATGRKAAGSQHAAGKPAGGQSGSQSHSTASPQGQVGQAHSQAAAHSHASAHAHGHANGHGGLALGLSASASASSSLGAS